MSSTMATRWRAKSPLPKPRRRNNFMRTSLIFLFAATCLAQQPIGPHSAFEPPAAKTAASLAASSAASPKDLLTTGEKTDWNETAPYAEAVEISRRMEKKSRAL